MTDHLAPATRSALMAKVRNKGTSAETAVRALVRGLGVRFTTHDRSLPGTPDLVFAARRKVIFVHGCFWHGHSCRRGKSPSSNLAFWAEKLARNKRRDRAAKSALTRRGVRYLVVWECELKFKAKLETKLRRFLAESTQ